MRIEIQKHKNIKWNCSLQKILKTRKITLKYKNKILCLYL